MNQLRPPEVILVPRWIQVPVGLFLAAILVFCLAGSLMLAFLPNEKSPILAPILGTSMSLVSV